MRIRLEQKWTARLLALPESGMGYQRVRLRLKDCREICDALVFNAEVLEVPAGVGPIHSADIAEIEIMDRKTR